MLPMTEAVANIPWLPLGEAVARVARHLGCTPGGAELRIVGKAKASQIKARGVIEDQPVWLLPVDWNGTIDLAGTTIRPPGASCEITNVELCVIDLIAAGLLPAPAEKARWSAAEAIAHLVKGVPLPWEAWQRAGASAGEIEQAQIDLGELIGVGVVPAWGRPSPRARKEQIPTDDFHADMIEEKAPRAGRRPKVVVRIDGTVGTSPPQRSADYRGPRWEAIEVDSAALRHARPRPLTTQAEPTPAADSEDHGEAAATVAETAGTQPKERRGTRPKKRRGTRGPPPKTTERVVKAIKDDIRTGYLTTQDGTLFEGSRPAKQENLKARYKCSTGTLRDARDIALLELETPTNSDETPTNSDKK
jgi:hypothetical protein